MICILSGLTLTLIVHWIIQICHLKPCLGPAPLIYSCLMSSGPNALAKPYAVNIKR